MLKSVVLSDGEPCRVRQLGLFELDGKGREILGPYKYSMLLITGVVVEDTYDLRSLDEEPEPPSMPPDKIEAGSVEWYQLQEFTTYQAAISHEKTRAESYQDYCLDIAQYILQYCLNPEDRHRVVTEDDWQAVYQAVLCPELTMEGVTACLRDVFYGYLQWASHSRSPFAYARRWRQDGSLALVGS